MMFFFMENVASLWNTYSYDWVWFKRIEKLNQLNEWALLDFCIYFSTAREYIDICYGKCIYNLCCLRLKFYF